jgi:hypothetical protein
VGRRRGCSPLRMRDDDAAWPTLMTYCAAGARDGSMRMDVNVPERIYPSARCSSRCAPRSIFDHVERVLNRTR